MATEYIDLQEKKKKKAAQRRMPELVYRAGGDKRWRMVYVLHTLLGKAGGKPTKNKAENKQLAVEQKAWLQFSRCAWVDVSLLFQLLLLPLDTALAPQLGRRFFNFPIIR